MTKYKSTVMDYEGMQECLDSHAAQGWRLFSCSADTWRKVEGGGFGDAEQSGPLDSAVGSATANVYSASYYLLIFVREEDPDLDTGYAEAVEEIPHKESQRKPSQRPY